MADFDLIFLIVFIVSVGILVYLAYKKQEEKPLTDVEKMCQEQGVESPKEFIHHVRIFIMNNSTQGPFIFLFNEFYELIGLTKVKEKYNRSPKVQLDKIVNKIERNIDRTSYLETLLNKLDKLTVTKADSEYYNYHMEIKGKAEELLQKYKK